MKKNTRGINYLLIELLISVLAFTFLFKGQIRMYTITALMVIYAVCMIKRFGLMKDNNYLKSYVNRVVIATLMAFLLVIYFIGLFIGFKKNLLNFSSFNIIKIVVTIILLTISQELIRYIIARNNPKEKMPVIAYAFIMVIVDIIMHSFMYNFHSREEVFIFISLIILPSIAKEMLSSFLVYKCSYVPSMIYRLAIGLYAYVFPIIPDLGNYLTAVIDIFLPFTIYYFASKTIRKHEKEALYYKKIVRKIVYIPLLIMVLIITSLITGIFKYKMIAVGSGSMEPTYIRGDAIIYEKEKPKNIDVGDILVFEKDNKLITHRVVKKSKVNNNIYFYTKGDANKSVDNFKITEEEVVGKVDLVVKYIGYPTLWLREVSE